MSGAERVCARRAFLRQVTGGAAAAVTLVLAACATAPVLRVRPVEGRIRVGPDEAAQASGPGGYARLQPEGYAEPVYLLATDAGLVALSPICTHLGCTVGVQGARLVCPCHGSTYDRTGRVLRGPAERSLRAFPVERHPDGSISIDLNGRAP